MTVPHDEQPLTRRALRELERQKPRKQQKEEARAAEVAGAAPTVAPPTAAAVASPEPAAVSPAAQPEAAAVPVAPKTDAPKTDAPETVAPETVTPEAVVVPAEAIVVPAQAAPAATMSRRARRALSADHPFAVDGAVQATAAAAETVAPPIEPAAPAAPATGPIIAELVPDDLNTGSTIVVEEPTATEATPLSSNDAEPDDAVHMVEELMVVDETVAPEVTAEEDDDFAEIDDTRAPDAVHIITIDENPPAPILAPLFQAPSPEREIIPAPTSNVVSSGNSFDDLIGSRGVGSSNIASTSALVLPSIPNHGDVGTALDETGEVIITGSIDLPMSLGSTGAAPADGLESADLDAYLDPDGDVGSDVAPVSATRAVSTHGTSSGLVAPPKRGSATAPVVLAVTAGVLAIGVVGLLLAAFVFRIF